MSKQAGVAQLVEHLICNQRVGGSTPSASSIILFRDQVQYINSVLGFSEAGAISRTDAGMRAARCVVLALPLSPKSSNEVQCHDYSATWPISTSTRNMPGNQKHSCWLSSVLEFLFSRPAAICVID